MENKEKSLEELRLENERLQMEIKRKELELKERELSVLEKKSGAPRRLRKALPARRILSSGLFPFF